MNPRVPFKVRFSIAIWKNGIFTNGEFHSKLNLIDGVTFPSEDNTISIWENGTWENGIWYGGTFYMGKWLTGTFYNGIVLNILWYKGHFANGIWKNGTMYEGTISGGMFENIISYNTSFGYDFEYIKEKSLT